MDKAIIFIICLLGCSMFFYKKNLKNHLILTCLFGLYLVLFHYQNSGISNLEHMTSDEALQNIASLYNSGTLRATNLELTGNLTVKGNLKVENKSELVGTLTAGDKSKFNSDVNFKNNVNIDKDLIIEGKTTMKSNLILNENLKMNDKKIIALGDVGMAYSNMPGKTGEGHFVVFRGSDGHNLLTQQVGMYGWALFNPNGQYVGRPWGANVAKIYENGKNDLQISKNTDLFA
jgi:hypothetical protein